MKQKANADSVEIVDPVIELPYEVKNINQPVTLSEGLGGKNVQGFVFIKLTINDNSEIVETSIMKLSLRNQKNNKVIEYNVSQGNIPADLNEYVGFFNEYCKKKLILEKKHNPQPKNLMQVRLKVE